MYYAQQHRSRREIAQLPVPLLQRKRSLMAIVATSQRECSFDGRNWDRTEEIFHYNMKGESVRSAAERRRGCGGSCGGREKWTDFPITSVRPEPFLLPYSLL
jgi:hypothetical protein